MAIGAGLVAVVAGLGLAIQPQKLLKTRWSLNQTRPEVVAQPNTGKRQPVPPVRGMSYHQARVLLLKDGWLLRRKPAGHGETAAVQSGNGPVFWERGYHELASCSGAGYAYCRFEYDDAKGENTLVVITAGVENPEDDRSQR
jgi:hypothetical protein